MCKESSKYIPQGIKGSSSPHGSNPTSKPLPNHCRKTIIAIILMRFITLSYGQSLQWKPSGDGRLYSPQWHSASFTNFVKLHALPSWLDLGWAVLLVGDGSVVRPRWSKVGLKNRWERRTHAEVLVCCWYVAEELMIPGVKGIMLWWPWWYNTVSREERIFDCMRIWWDNDIVRGRIKSVQEEYSFRIKKWKYVPRLW